MSLSYTGCSQDGFYAYIDGEVKFLYIYCTPCVAWERARWKTLAHAAALLWKLLVGLADKISNKTRITNSKKSVDQQQRQQKIIDSSSSQQQQRCQSRYDWILIKTSKCDFYALLVQNKPKRGHLNCYRMWRTNFLLPEACFKCLIQLAMTCFNYE